MKQPLPVIIPGILLIFVLASWSNTSLHNKEPFFERNVQRKTMASAIDGAWEIVWATYDGKLQTPQKYRQFKMFNNGIFSLLATDSSGNLTYAGYGKYELDGNLYKETFIYHDAPKYCGGIVWQEYKLTGDTLYTKGFTKVLINGKDETASFPKLYEKRVRVKW